MKHLGLIALLPLLAACASNPKDEQTCPSVAVVRDLHQFADFGRAEKPARAEFVAAARLDGVRGDCGAEDKKIVANIDIAMRAFRGPRLGGDRAEFPYFVAVLDRDDYVVAKQNLSATFSLTQNDKMVEKVEAVRVNIPNPVGRDGRYWRVLVGFQLSPEQLAFNRGEFGEPKAWPSPAGRVQRQQTP
jgi:hypothetical protein